MNGSESIKFTGALEASNNVTLVHYFIIYYNFVKHFELLIHCSCGILVVQ